MSIRVFLLDDHEMVRRGLADILGSADDIEVVGEAGTLLEGVPAITEIGPDVAVIDVVLPDGNGVEAVTVLREHAPDVRVVVLTSFSDDETLFSAIDAGAAGYLLKRIAAPELVDSVRKVAAGHSLVDPRLTDRMFDRLRSGTSPDEERLALLNDRERELLELVAEGLTNRQIGDRLHLSEKTVKNYVSAMLKKMDMDTRTEAAVFATQLRARRDQDPDTTRGG